MEMSLFYFAADAGSTADAYELLVEGAKFADRNGFSAVWTPERHFHPFGGPYPNPAVTGAAIATITRNVAIRAGSVVLPLQDPIRVAEEWAVVDNLSGGRVGLAFASGWHAVDFALAPGGYENRRAELTERLEQVRTLWRGGAIERLDGLGNPVKLEVYPRPVQAEPPIWITSAGDVTTFEMAGRMRANVLTHLFNQDLDELTAKITAYRTARGDGGTVTLMLHTFAGTDDADVRDTVLGPLSAYLRQSLSLMTATLGPDHELGTAEPDPDEVDFLVGRAAERYYRERGLFGSVGTCTAFLDRVAACGVDEVACLIDFGVAPAETIAGLGDLRRVAEAFRSPH
ncbi:MupA/Atu3671 family FMN-dependent luciferase-like monooxygenase [Actinomadura sp. DC4]|uniref:MupA/Atu3671 family FMN-dependent luciferase-like monooxygenase n=1 Tax=Actinomadura sp. DC4 TaxID=3055069 RepID=UPI0025B13F8C|nr:MupA/Atu3671 family FMN-dependent luciferase-like monooxygenase [Actinomadura sp. DC4]MDN3358594.1 LLM class flavin-dependent oxidoreductase [Actinomadura sp. DC4]